MKTALRLLLALVVLLGLAAPSAHAQMLQATDVLGRTVSLPHPPRRIVLAPGRYLPALAIVEPTVIDRIAGIGVDLHRRSPDVFAAYAERFPRLKALPALGTGPGQTAFPLEPVLGLRPDLVILSRNEAGAVDPDGSNALLATFRAAGIPVLVIDFFVHPLEDTARSMATLGAVLGHPEQAAAFNAFTRQHLDAVASRLPARPEDRPTVFLHAHAGGMACCFSPGRGTFDDLIRAAGGRNVAAPLLPGATGQLSPEKLLSLDPAVYVATGGTYQIGKGGLVLGGTVTPETARTTLDEVLSAPALAALGAVHKGRAFGLWQGFGDTPFNLLAVEVMARWLYPGAMATVDPQNTLAEINARFTPVPLDGTFWIAALPR